VRWFFDHSNISRGYKTMISKLFGFGPKLVEIDKFFRLSAV
jgi:hypothetical protein